MSKIDQRSKGDQSPNVVSKKNASVTYGSATSAGRKGKEMPAALIVAAGTVIAAVIYGLFVYLD